MKLPLTGRLPRAQAPAPDVGRYAAARDYRLDSALPGALFLASIRASWLPHPMGGESRIFQHLGSMGNKVTSHFSVLDVAAANDAVNTSFATRREIPGSDIRLVFAHATLNVAQEDRDFAERKADIERRASIEAAGLEAKHAYLMRLRDLFLSDAAITGLWWSNGDPDRVLRLTEHAGAFDTIVSEITGSPHGPARQDKIAPLIDRFLTGLGPDHREYLIGQLAKVFDGYQQSDLAEELRGSGS
jgi:hypothetical protein